VSAAGSLPADFFLRDADTLARELLGRWLVRSVGGSRKAVARIVETEAYLGVDDPASHAYGGRRTQRTETMYRRGGCAYVYLIYGMYHCLNIVAGPVERPHAVLIRAVEALEGYQWMRRNRGRAGRLRPGELGGGPGKLCQALAIDRSLDGTPLSEGPLRCAVGEPVAEGAVVRGPRVGIDYAGDAAAWPLRFAIRGNREVSRPAIG
jgi:DNA-3-methyladenine glycosylase